MSYKLQCQGEPRRTSNGEILAMVVLVDESGASLFSDKVNLTLIKSRSQFAKELLSRFPILKGQDIEGQLLELMRQVPADRGQDNTERIPQAQVLVALARKAGQEFFHDGDRTYAAMVLNSHREILPIQSKKYKQWLSRAYFDAEDGKVPNLDALGAAINALGGLAIYDGKNYELANRVAWSDGDLWYDLTDNAWRAVKVSLDGWKIVDNPPILFERHAHQVPIVPVRGGDPKSLLKYLRYNNDAEAILWLTYVGSLFIPDIPHLIPGVYGDSGSGKSTWLRLIAMLVDPSVAPLLSVPKDETALLQTLNHRWLTFYDNVSSVPDWFSDALCRTCTGQAAVKRTLFTDDDDFIYRSFKRCVGLNGINNMAEKADLLDRSLLVHYQRIQGEDLIEEKVLLSEFEVAKPAILGGFFDVLADALVIKPEINLPWRSRMVDFMIWGAALARAMGYSQQTFLDAYADNIRTQNQTALAASLVAPAIQEFMNTRENWTGTYGTLLGELGPIAESLKTDTHQRAWPKNASWLSRRINQVRVNLQAVGISVEVSGSGRDVSFRKVSGNAVFAENGVFPERDSGTTAKIERCRKMPFFAGDDAGAVLSSTPEVPEFSNGKNGNPRQTLENAVVPTSQPTDHDQNGKHGISADLGGGGHDENQDRARDLPSQFNLGEVLKDYLGQQRWLYFKVLQEEMFRDNAMPPHKPCYTCGSTKYWLRRAGVLAGPAEWVCCQCHPEPGANVQVEGRFWDAILDLKGSISDRDWIQLLQASAPNWRTVHFNMAIDNGFFLVPLPDEDGEIGHLSILSY